jgi:DNA-binding beta-propeller fold protein YncE
MCGSLRDSLCWTSKQMLYFALLAICWTAAAATEAPATATDQVRNPYGLTIGPDKALYICEIDTHRVSRLDLKTGKLTAAAEGGLQQPYEVRFDRKGNMFFVDMPAHKVYRVDAKSRKMEAVAGTGEAGFGGDGGPAAKALFKQPHSIVFDPSGKSLLICDIGNHRIRRIDLASGVIETFAGTGERKPTPDGSPRIGTPLNGPRAIDFDRDGNLWLVLREGNVVLKLLNDRWVHVAGTGEKGLTDGAAKTAKLNGPKGIAAAPDGTMYIADTENHAVRRIDPKAGTIATVATGMKRPHGVFVNRKGVVYVGDSENHKVTVLPAAPR